MRRIKNISSILIPILFLACGSGNQKPSSLFDITFEGNIKQVHQNDEIGVSIENRKDKEIEHITYSIDGKEIPLKENKLLINVSTLGNKILMAKIKFDGETVEIKKSLKVLSEKAPEIYTYTIINEYPHDTGAYTQGLEFHNDTLYEGTGKKGRSFLRKLNYKTGEVFEQIDLDKSYFGEGITILNNKIYQLTWQSGMGFIYDLKTFKKLDNFQYGKSREGWGLTNDGKKIFKSDGTEKIWFLNPETMMEEGYIETVTNSSVFNKANELEYVDGKLYANVYQKPSVMIINSASGSIEGVINFGGLSDKITKTEDWNETDNVLNGIAYHPERETFFVTGKDWDILFEVKIQKK
ncbi:glutaminyl-peptide cyclotransferase [Maribacter sp. X9]|uniref:glutaminyl-peptide cyclotransferase n=1 Tax=Maribacter sp. X9 TaxID=3402159 RepID=UPI003AF3F2B2